MSPSNWGTQPIQSAFRTHHSHPPPTLHPTLTRLPHPFIVCIIGASGKIGSSIALSYTQAGASALILASRRIPHLENLAQKCHAENSALEMEIWDCDVTCSKSVEGLAERIRRRWGRLDVVVLVSGVSGLIRTKLTETEVESFEEVTGTNYVGTFFCVKFLVPLMLEEEEEEEDVKKTFIGVSSMAAMIVRGPIANTQYCVSKCAQLKLLEHVHEQYQDQGLNCFAVHPGAVLSEQAERLAPIDFLPYLTDSPDLCGAFCVWLTVGEKQWLSGRLVSANWDVDELEGKKEEIVAKDALKLQLSLP
ncbi:NAD(P)-binding protein [Sphaerulina musiva SO2202]|uniref:NAD(P)-binding protein n=1 Tax=Sphaerulina musiva (strain SO2202) TaxID=692275 RepID=M3B3C2_SPHMS|nr:NAD(P)-binding protein [Sphaerulina musiva SO2202]EMF14292.1 NAD(P)-binding protein [Sphaerulina musiva SO2202]